MDYERLNQTTTTWYSGSHTHSVGHPIFTSNVWAETIDRITKQKETEMTTLDKIHKERREAAERVRVETAYEALDALELDGVLDGVVLLFLVDDGADAKTYAVLRADGRWWATGGTSPNGVQTEDLLAWMIRKNVDPARIEVRS